MILRYRSYRYEYVPTHINIRMKNIISYYLMYLFACFDRIKGFRLQPHNRRDHRPRIMTKSLP